MSIDKESGSYAHRLIGLDLARAIAVIGMVIVNFKMVMGASESGPQWMVWLANLMEGRSAATFVILAGVGISLMSKRIWVSHDSEIISKTRTVLLKRAVFLFVVGLLYTPLWPADILHFYAIYIFVASFLLIASNRVLWFCAAAACVGFIILFFIVDYETGWNFITMDYTDLWTVEGFFRHMFYNGFHPALPWVAFIFVGMWLGRLDLQNYSVRRRIMWISLITVVLAESVAIIAEQTLDYASSMMLDTAPMPPMPLYLVAGAGTAILIIMLCLEFTHKPSKSKILEALISTGQLSLTIYVAHVVLGMGILEELGKLENQTLSFASLTAIVFCISAIAFSYFWRKRFKQGPLEMLMRKVTG